MSIDILDRKVGRIAVIGSGQIGPDIALHFSKVFAPQGTPVVVVDISEEALAAGRAPEPTLAEAAAVMRLIEAERESLRCGGEVLLRP